MSDVNEFENNVSELTRRLLVRRERLTAKATLLYSQGMNIQEIAEELDLSESQVQSLSETLSYTFDKWFWIRNRTIYYRDLY